jgi:allantoicase
MDFTTLIDLAGERLGGAVLLANDEFFAAKENLIRPAAPAWREGEYTERGKWMDGWETRRRRQPGHDWCIVRLGRPGIIRGFVVDTAYFTGNYPESCSIEACTVTGVPDPAVLVASTSWTEILPRSPLKGNTQNLFALQTTERYTHLRLNIFPDGGVARLRVHGVVLPDWERLARRGNHVDLAAAENGGWVVDASDAHYGNPAQMLMPGLPAGMHDGWETKRRRGPGNDWAVVRLAARGVVRNAVVDTSHFKGNAPGWCSLDACDAPGTELPPPGASWVPLLPQQPLQPHTVHEFARELLDAGAATYVRLNIFPDGGVARLRLWGERA